LIGTRDPLELRAQRLVDRAGELAAITSRPNGCSRLAFSAELAAALDLFRGWLEPMGLPCEMDAAGNLSALLPGTDRRSPRLLLGSHLDTVLDGGRWDGTLGVLVAADCVERLADASTPPVCDVEILVFADEEGVRFGTGCFGSRALAGRVPTSELERVDADGVRLQEALDGFHARAGGGVESARRDPRTLGAFLEVHIEQGPILEQLDLPIGVVSAIAGNTRAELRFDGLSGHAGTVPMGERHDALAAAAAWTVEVERRVSAEPKLVGTVGALSALPGQVNVIAGSASATLDVRGPDDAKRRRVVEQLRRDSEHQAGLRGTRVAWTETLDRPAAPMDPQLIDEARRALARSGQEPPLLVSGAGHDAAVMASVCPTLLLFVRCREGLSHHPDEHVAPEDVRSALEATDIVLEEWLARWPW
jgi:allantoate deiminase